MGFAVVGLGESLSGKQNILPGMNSPVYIKIFFEIINLSFVKGSDL